MAKHIAIEQRVEIREGAEQGWVDISDLVVAYTIEVAAGELTYVELELVYNRELIHLTAPRPSVLNIACDDKIEIQGVDISDHVGAYTYDVEVGEPEKLVVRYQADSDTLRINGGAPWEPSILNALGQLLDEAVR